MSIQHTAFHEAGHTVIAYRFGIIYGMTSIIPDKKRDGFFRADINKLPDSQIILILFAGDAAKKHYDPADRSEPSRGDYRKVWKLSENMPPEKYRSLLSQSKDLVSDNFKQIQAIAEAVLEVKFIDQYLGKSIIDAVDNDKNWRELLEWTIWKEWHPAE